MCNNLFRSGRKKKTRGRCYGKDSYVWRKKYITLSSNLASLTIRVINIMWKPCFTPFPFERIGEKRLFRNHIVTCKEMMSQEERLPASSFGKLCWINVICQILSAHAYSSSP